MIYTFVPMFNTIRTFTGLILLLLGSTFTAKARSEPGKQLEALYELAGNYNRKGEFKRSIEMYNSALRSDTLTAEERFYVYLFKSYTYKWLSDYKSVERNLLLADQTAKKTSIYPELRSFLQIELATLYFDINQYDKSDSVMKVIRAGGFQYMEEYAKGLIYMQEAYICFLKKQYREAEPLYLASIKLMNESESNCNTPIVYWKLQALYLAQGRIAEAESAIEKGLAIAKKCDIEKYTMYMYAEAAIHYAKIGRFEEAFSYRLKEDSVRKVIDQKEHISELAGLEKQFQQEYEVDMHRLKVKTLEAQTNFNYLMAALIGCAVFISTLLYSWKRYRKSKRYRDLKNQFTADLFNNIEQERKRIAYDLHDGISHDLLSIKLNATDQQTVSTIDGVIKEIRHISRNLHPVMFDKLGLKNSLEQLVARLQTHSEIVLTTEINYSVSIGIPKEIQLYRIAQEALTNAVKYSDAIAVRVGLKQQGNSLILEIQDNGKGFDTTKVIETPKSFGLQSIIARSEAISGKAVIKSSSAGTHITISLSIP